MTRVIVVISGTYTVTVTDAVAQNQLGGSNR